MQTVIETQSLSKIYGSRPAVDRVSLHVPQGCVYGFIGPNGAGKSTTMKMLLGLIHPSAGQVFLLGQELTAQNRLSLLRQTGSLIADLKGVSRKDISRVLEIVHLTKDRNRKVGQFSLGMKQRLGIAMALLGNPELLILDEPTNGLDPAGIQEMRALLADMPAATGTTVFLSSHLLGEMEQMVEQVGIIQQGKLLFEGSLQDLQQHSRGAVSLRLLYPQKAIPLLHANGIPVQQKENVLTLPPLQEESLAALVRAVADSGAGVVELNRHTKSLEEIFLSLTDSKEVS